MRIHIVSQDSKKSVGVVRATASLAKEVAVQKVEASYEVDLSPEELDKVIKDNIVQEGMVIYDDEDEKDASLDPKVLFDKYGWVPSGVVGHN